MNQRLLPEDQPIVPPAEPPAPAPPDDDLAASPETIAFDKADEAEAIERTHISINIEIAELEATLATTKDSHAKATISAKLTERKQHASALAKVKPTPNT